LYKYKLELAIEQMKIKVYKPTTPGRRQMTGLDFRQILTRGKPKKKLTSGFRRAKGRNILGRITVRHKGGGAKRLYREIDFKYDKRDIPARVQSCKLQPLGFFWQPTDSKHQRKHRRPKRRHQTEAGKKTPLNIYFHVKGL